ncbi:hypothetical protein D3C84_1041220 [compost metagenome]
MLRIDEKAHAWVGAMALRAIRRRGKKTLYALIPTGLVALISCFRSLHAGIQKKFGLLFGILAYHICDYLFILLSIKKQEILMPVLRQSTRAIIFVPADSERKLAKAAELEADA